MKKILPLVVLPLLTLGACGGSPSSSATKTVTKTVTTSASSATKSDEPQSEASDTTTADDATSDVGTPLAFGDTFTSPTGRKVTLSALEPYTPSESAALDEDAPKGSVYRKLKITLDNASKETYDSGDISLSAMAGERSVSTIVDGEVGDSPYVKILPGRKLAWTVAYAVMPGQHLTVEVSTLGGTVATWDGAAVK